MSGTHLGSAPLSDEEWARDVQRRLEALEQPAAVRAGDWVLTTSPDTGNLIASHSGGGSTIISVPPPSGQDPDAVSDNIPPSVMVTLDEPQRINYNTVTRVVWDTVQDNVGGWGFDIRGDATDVEAGIQGVEVPSDDLYLIVLYLPWVDSGRRTWKSFLRIDDIDVMLHEGRQLEAGLYPGSSNLSTVRRLAAGQTINVNTMSSTNPYAEIGAPANDPAAVPFLSVTGLRG